LTASAKRSAQLATQSDGAALGGDALDHRDHRPRGIDSAVGEHEPAELGRLHAIARAPVAQLAWEEVGGSSWLFAVERQGVDSDVADHGRLPPGQRHDIDSASGEQANRLLVGVNNEGRGTCGTMTRVSPRDASRIDAGAQ
jgi:hypothetical protein